MLVELHDVVSALLLHALRRGDGLLDPLVLLGRVDFGFGPPGILVVVVSCCYVVVS